MAELNSSKMLARAGRFRAHLREPWGPPIFDRARPLIKPEVKDGPETVPLKKRAGGEIINTSSHFLAGLVGTGVLALILMIAR